MSRVFYDHLLELEELESLVHRLSEGPEEREELERLVDEIVHHRVLGCILDNLPREHHERFLQNFYAAPYDRNLLIFLQEKTPQSLDIEKKIQKEVGLLKKELLAEIKKRK